MNPVAIYPQPGPSSARRPLRAGLRWLLAGLVVVGTLAILALAAAWWFGVPTEGLVMTVDGETFELPVLSGWQGLALVGGLMLAALLALVVVPLALLLGLALPLVLVALVLAALVAGALGIGLLLASPLLLPLALAWWLWTRGSTRRAVAASPAAAGVKIEP